MQVLVITNTELKDELLTGAVNSDLHLHFIHTLSAFQAEQSYDACIDLLFEPAPERIKWLSERKISLVIVNSVITTLEEIGQPFIRINGWPTFLKRAVIEASFGKGEQEEKLKQKQKEKVERLFMELGKEVEWVPDITGFVTPRVIASIINEAFFALEEKVSTQEEIDTAMKLGTNYPLGPFEWGKKIGLNNIYQLLSKLSLTQERYKPGSLFQQTA